MTDWMIYEANEPQALFGPFGSKAEARAAKTGLSLGAIVRRALRSDREYDEIGNYR